MKSLRDIKKMFLLLASDIPGERDAAVAAIDRTLKKAGLDWHDAAAKFDDTPESGPEGGGLFSNLDTTAMEREMIKAMAADIVREERVWGTCRHCGREFTRRRKSKCFCSTRCRVAAHRKA